MQPITFPEANRTWAKDQPPYLPLPAYTDDRETVSLWRFTWRERLAVLLGANLWLRICNFGHALQPQAPTLVSPFEPTAGGDAAPRREGAWDLPAAVMVPPPGYTPASEAERMRAC